MRNRSSDVTALDLPDIHIRSTRMGREQETIVEIESTTTVVACRRCGRTIGDFAGYDRPRSLPDLSTPSGTTRVLFYPKRFFCPDCADHPTTIEQLGRPAADGVNEKMVGA